MCNEKEQITSTYSECLLQLAVMPDGKDICPIFNNIVKFHARGGRKASSDSHILGATSYYLLHDDDMHD